jgi:hypothetical protein
MSEKLCEENLDITTQPKTGKGLLESCNLRNRKSGGARNAYLTQLSSSPYFLFEIV